MNLPVIRGVLRAGAFACAAVLLASCGRIDVPKVPGVTPYRMEIQQGNYVSQDMVEQLKPGMTREQVRFILGTPLVTDLFHANRWDFVYYRERANGKREQRNLSVIFEDNKLARVVGDLLPSGAAKPAAAAFPSVKQAEEAPKPRAEPKPAAKPVANPAADAPKPEQAAQPAPSAPAGQNWRAASDEPAKPEPKAEDAPKEEARKADEEPKERGFFGRLRDKLGL